MEVTVGDGIASLALVVSAYTLWRQHKSNVETSRLNALLIQKEEAESVSGKKAELAANFVNTAKSSYQFRIYNRGKGMARNIRMEVFEGVELFAKGDLARAFPYPSLDTHQPLNISVPVHFGSPRRVRVKLMWDDDAGGGEKEITADVF